VGCANNGLVAVWPGANMQGAFDLGFSAEATVGTFQNPPAMWVIGEADPVAEDARVAQLIEQAEFVVVSSMFMTPTAEKADLVLPIQSFAEREGTFTNGMRRVQRFYMAQTPFEGTLPAWKVFAHIGSAMQGGDKPRIAPAQVMRDMTQHVLRYAGMDYLDLARVEAQFPTVGGSDLYYGGTAYTNDGGLGIQWATNAEKEKYRLTVRPVKTAFEKHEGLKVVPVRVLYDRDVLFSPSKLMHPHVPAPYALLNPRDAAGVGVADGDSIAISVGEQRVEVTARVNAQVPTGSVLLPQRLAATPIASGVCTVQKIGE
jgi:predicted molibdopterin-dependent oxidoreductase YjgC